MIKFMFKRHIINEVGFVKLSEKWKIWHKYMNHLVLFTLMNQITRKQRDKEFVYLTEISRSVACTIFFKGFLVPNMIGLSGSEQFH